MDEQNSDQYTKKSYPVNDPDKRTFTMCQVAGAIQRVTQPVFKQKPFATAQLLSDWVDIIGHHYGSISLPQNLYNGTLTIACTSTTAAEMHYIAHNLIQKINLYCGRTVVKKVKFISSRGAIASLTKKSHLSARPPSPIRIHDFPSGPLQEALAKLGGHLKHQQRGR